MLENLCVKQNFVFKSYFFHDFQYVRACIFMGGIEGKELKKLQESYKIHVKCKSNINEKEA